MKLRYVMPFILAGVSACTMTPEGDGLKGEFHPPFTYSRWDAHTYVAQNGADVCALSSGYNGLTVLFSRHREQKNAPIYVDVKGNRTMIPGAMLDANLTGGNFQTYEEYFPSVSAKRMVDLMAKGGKLYLEWSERSSTYGGAPRRVQSIVPLDGLGGKIKECRDTLR